MKKLFTLVISFFICYQGFAQKDFEFKLLSPKTGADIYVMETFLLAYSIKNTGNDWINSDDSLIINLTVDGNEVFGGFHNKLVAHANVPPGDSVYITESFAFTDKTNTPFSFCFDLKYIKDAMNRDTFMANNHSCSQLTVKDRNTGIAETAYENEIIVYPNPAINSITIQSSNAAVKKVQLSDMTGRVVAVTELANSMVRLTTADFEGGLYICRMTDDLGNVIASARVAIVK